MQLSVGVDMVEIARIARAMENPRFLSRFFSAEEQALFAERGNRPATVAANYAAKEAFAKAAGTGLRGFALKEVAVLRDALGAPYYRLSGRAEALHGKKCWRVSLSHTAENAIAFAVAADEEEARCLQ